MPKPSRSPCLRLSERWHQSRRSTLRSSKAAGIYYLTDALTPTLTLRKLPFEFISSIIPTVVSTVTEAELAAIFLNGQAGVPSCNTLADLHYPHPATPILIDNTTAADITSNTVRLKRYKAIDMHYHCIRERAQRGEYTIRWEPGCNNLAELLRLPASFGCNPPCCVGPLAFFRFKRPCVLVLVCCTSSFCFCLPGS